MSNFKSSIIKGSVKWHRLLGLLGALALFIFGLSGATHPIMAWTGPQAAKFFPPSITLKADDVRYLPRVLKQNKIAKAKAIKVVPSEQGPLLQITEEESAPRRYFNLKSGVELPNHDLKQAEWLARYYTGLNETPISQVSFQTEFSDAYPWVNRLLPVYKISFASQDNLEVYIYTELSALANISNDWKLSLQRVFGLFHTWNWLNDNDKARVIIMAVFLAALLGMTLTGFAMILLFKKRKIADPGRRAHRWLAYCIWLPLFALSASGTYHLLQHAYAENHRGLRLGTELSLSGAKLPNELPAINKFEGTKLNGLSLISGSEGILVYRVGLSVAQPDQNVDRAGRFEGRPTESSAKYVFLDTGLEWTNSAEREMAAFYAHKHLDLHPADLSSIHMITSFGPTYDFRNKRLPVLQLDYKTPRQDRVFVDPVTGSVVDHLVKTERLEALSFSFLHKWNFLVPLIGREARDVLIVLLLALAIISAGFGIKMSFKKKS